MERTVSARMSTCSPRVSTTNSAGRWSRATDSRALDPNKLKPRPRPGLFCHGDQFDWGSRTGWKTADSGRIFGG
jgi:hypothetical protein